MRRATEKYKQRSGIFYISIHALREEGDIIFFSSFLFLFKFQSTPSVRRATPAARCAGTATKISIHALREEGDRIAEEIYDEMRNFNPRPP